MFLVENLLDMRAHIRQILSHTCTTTLYRLNRVAHKTVSSIPSRHLAGECGRVHPLGNVSANVFLFFIIPHFLAGGALMCTYGVSPCLYVCVFVWMFAYVFSRSPFLTYVHSNVGYNLMSVSSMPFCFHFPYRFLHVLPSFHGIDANTEVIICINIGVFTVLYVKKAHTYSYTYAHIYPCTTP